MSGGLPGPGGPVARLALPPLPELVRTARLVAGAAARRSGVPEEVLDEVRLAVAEAVARAVVRHRATGCPDPVRVLLRDEPDRFTVEVQDVAGAAAPVPQEDLDDATVLALVAALADRASVEPGPAGQVVRLVWAIEAGPAATRRGGAGGSA